MDYLGSIDMTLTYSTPGGETQVTHSGVTATLFFIAPHRTWSVLVDDQVNLQVLDGLIRAEVILADGRRIDGAARRTTILGNSFELVEDGQPMTHASRIDAVAAFSSVDQLRELLAGIPGTAQVSIDGLPEGARFDTLALLTALDDGELSPMRVARSELHRVTSVCICEASGVSQ
ncbi:hypothetical protein [Pseudomonas chlororaphis]